MAVQFKIFAIFFFLNYCIFLLRFHRKTHLFRSQYFLSDSVFPIEEPIK